MNADVNDGQTDDRNCIINIACASINELRNDNNNNIRLIRRCQNATRYNDMENSQETRNGISVRLLVAVFIQLSN